MDSYLQRVQEAISEATQAISLEELKWHPEGKWSIAEVLEHLSLSYSGTTLGFRRCLQSNKRLATAPSFKCRMRAFVVLKLNYFPEGRQAPANTRPKGAPAETILSVIQQNLSAMEKVIGESEQEFGRDVKVLDHPILGALTAEEWRRFHWIHARHHMRQIERLRSMANAGSGQ